MVLLRALPLALQAFCLLILHTILQVYGCYYHLTAHTGSLMSHEDLRPFFKPKTRCTWDIVVKNSFRIELGILVFELANDCCSCTKDYVAFYDGLTKDSPLIGRYCGEKHPDKIYSSGSSLLVEFFSSGKSTANNTSINKFRAKYKAIHGSLIKGSSGDVVSPGYSQSSVGNYLYTIVVPYGWVKLTFDRIRIGGSRAHNYVTEKCGDDYIIVKDMYLVEYKGRQRSEIICGWSNSYFYSAVDRHLSLFYVSTGHNGFKARFEAVMNDTMKCGGMLQEDAGYIYSYGFPQAYPANRECDWKIEVRYGYVELRFLIFNFSKESSLSHCPFGHVDVYDGWSVENSVKIRTSCGLLTNAPRIVSRTTRLLVRARSTNYSWSGTFKLSYKITEKGLCNETKEFTCHSRTCIPKERVCDEQRDCSDGSDELNCPKMQKHNKILYVLWILLIIVAVILIGFWLWRTWKKSVRHSLTAPRNETHQPSCTNTDNSNPGEDGYRLGRALPTYSEALLQIDGNLPTYEEAVGTVEEDTQQVLLDGENVSFIDASNSTAQPDVNT